VEKSDTYFANAACSREHTDLHIAPAVGVEDNALLEQLLQTSGMRVDHPPKFDFHVFSTNPLEQSATRRFQRVLHKRIKCNQRKLFVNTRILRSKGEIIPTLERHHVARVARLQTSPHGG